MKLINLTLAVVLGFCVNGCRNANPAGPSDPAVYDFTGKIAFERNGNICVIDSNTAGVVSLTSGWHPGWSYDGNSIVFQSDRGGDSELYAMDSDGGNIRNLTNFPFSDSFVPVWSPTRNMAAFMVNTLGQHYINYVYTNNGTNVEIAAGDDPSWSPDGNSVAYSAYRDGGGREILTIRADGAIMTRLTFDPADDHEPAWSPDGSCIAFIRDRDLCVMDVTGANFRKFTDDYDDDESPAWSPDGKQLVFVRKGGLYLINSDGSGLCRLGGDEFKGRDPSWK